MASPTERGLHIAGLEIQVRCNRPDLLDVLMREFVGYEPRGGAPDVVLEYEAREDFRPSQLPTHPWPGYTARWDGSSYRYWRKDSEGVLVEADGGPVIARFQGIPLHWTIEATMRVTTSVALARVGGLLVHSCGVVAGDRALLFSGPSGAGKSTLARLLTEQHGEMARLGDDLVAVRPDPASPSGWRAHATPFNGELGRAPETSAPLGAVYFLMKGARHERRPLPTGDALRRLLRNTMAYVDEARAADRALEATAGLSSRVDAFVLEFSLGPGVTQVLEIT